MQIQRENDGRLARTGAPLDISCHPFSASDTSTADDIAQSRQAEPAKHLKLEVQEMENKTFTLTGDDAVAVLSLSRPHCLDTAPCSLP
jgi:hypothetical protein